MKKKSVAGLLVPEGPDIDWGSPEAINILQNIRKAVLNPETKDYPVFLSTDEINTVSSFLAQQIFRTIFLPTEEGAKIWRIFSVPKIDGSPPSTYFIILSVPEVIELLAENTMEERAEKAAFILRHM